MRPNLDQLASSVCEVARKAGILILKESAQFSISKAESKGLHDMVSYVDRESEKYITSALSDLLPGSGFITEEGTIEENIKEYTWIIDPLDGTTNFLHQLSPYSVSIALSYNGKVILGVVYVIGSDELFYAIRGKGAYMNGEAIRVSETKELNSSLIATGFPYNNFSRLESFMRCLEYFMRNCQGVRRLGSAAVDLAYVACGRFDAFYEYNLNPWDVSAGLLIVREAGGHTSDFTGNDIETIGLETIASNKFIFKEFREIVGNFMAS
jgi:myo-inositol-1(or 4)-monophosphatase